MSDEPDNLMLQQLRAIRSDTAAIRRTLTEHGTRLTALSLAVARLRQDDACDAMQRAHAEARVHTLE